MKFLNDENARSLKGQDHISQPNPNRNGLVKVRLVEEDKAGHSDQDLILLSGWKVSVLLFHSITFALCVAFTHSHTFCLHLHVSKP
jgi:hypothetical protein